MTVTWPPPQYPSWGALFLCQLANLILGGSPCKFTWQVDLTSCHLSSDLKRGRRRRWQVNLTSATCQVDLSSSTCAQTQVQDPGKSLTIFRTLLEFESWGYFSSNVKVNPIFSWKGPFQQKFPPYSQHFTTPLAALRRESLVALHDTLHESTFFLSFFLSSTPSPEEGTQYNGIRKEEFRENVRRIGDFFREHIWSCDRR